MKKLGHPLPLRTKTAVAIARHPIHPMVVPFPIAFLMIIVATDLAYLRTADEFWARTSLWLAGGGTLPGIGAGIIGTAELLLIRGIRHRAAGWSHFVLAVMLLAVAFINWLTRLDSPTEAIHGSGLYLSLLGAGLVAIAGWLGGDLCSSTTSGLASTRMKIRLISKTGMVMRSGARQTELGRPVSIPSLCSKGPQ